MDKKSDSIPIPGPSRLVQALTAIKTYDTREPNQVSSFFFDTFFYGILHSSAKISIADCVSI